MSTAVIAERRSTNIADPRMAAFLSRSAPEIFHSVATPTAIWQADPYDVETIHAEAREAFEHALNRAARTPSPPSGAILVLQGEAGSGKTHLMRAFRTRAHGQGLGYCGYLQMTSEAGNYARYTLINLLNSLEQPYDPVVPSRTGLDRLSAAVLESVPGLTGADLEEFRAGDGDATRLVDEYADRLHEAPRFRACDLELLRVMLHLQRNESRVHSRALMWLRCQPMRSQDTVWLGDVIPRTDPADPMRMLKGLARLTDIVQGVPIVLLIDQLEDIANQSAPVERFLKIIDTITGFTDSVPNSVVVLACLEDYFKENSQKLTKAKTDRLTRDPEPIRLRGLRTTDEVHEMTVRRLAYLYDTAELGIDPDDELFPFREEHLARLNNMRSRDVLDYLRKHHQTCIIAGEWREPEGTVVDEGGKIQSSDFDQTWNEFHTGFEATVPDSEEELAATLANAIAAASGERPDGTHFECEADGRYLQVETHRSDNKVDRLLVAVCNANTRGPSFGKQLVEVEQRAGEIPVAIVRTTDFPKSGKAATQLAGMLRRDGRKVVVADADWRRMLAFAAFQKEHAACPDFSAWQQSSQPLGQLDSLHKILNLGSLPTASVPTPVSAPAQPKIIPPPDPEPVIATSGPIVLGKTVGLSPEPLSFDPDEFTYHAAFLGATGSGKTTAALNIIEQLLLRGIPAVLVDRKGDLCRYADPDAWTRPLDDPARAAMRQSLRDRLDVALFTPGEPSGRPLALPVVPEGLGQLPEADRERFAQYAAGSLGSMIGFRSSDADKGQRAILGKAIETMVRQPGAVINPQTLRDLIERQDDALINAIGGGYPGRYYETLAQRLLTLELNNKRLLTGDEKLDVDALLGTGAHAQPGRVRLSVISTRFLGDGARVDFWVAQLLTSITRWCAKSPQPHLQAVFLFDEADIYLPATRQPATKGPMEDLLRRARAAGVGLFLASQSPGDFDYRCRENVRNWLIGRVTQSVAINKLKPMLAAAKGNVADKLGGQSTGAFYLVRESEVRPVRSVASLIQTAQMPEAEIACLARRRVHER